MSKKDKLFTEELARRNPDWDKIVAAHNGALALEREKLDRMTKMYFEASGHFTDLLNALRKISATALYRDGYQAKEIADAAIAKLSKQ